MKHTHSTQIQTWNTFQTKTLGLLTILFSLWIVLYFIPDILLSLFHTLLGNLLLITIAVFAYTKHKYLGIGLAIVFVVLYRTLQSKDGFIQKSVHDFLKIQDTINPHKVFDIDILSTQASQEELDYFNQYGMWPWSVTTIDEYIQAIHKNPYVRNNQTEAVNYARTIYNEAAIRRVLYNQSKEGQFLINGVYLPNPDGNPYEELPSGFGSFPYESGLQENRTLDHIQCSMKNSEQPYLERIQFTGKDAIFGSQLEQRTPLDFHTLESIIPGFKFQDKPCNPCNALRPVPDYSCKFSIQTRP